MTASSLSSASKQMHKSAPLFVHTKHPPNNNQTKTPALWICGQSYHQKICHPVQFLWRGCKTRCPPLLNYDASEHADKNKREPNSPGTCFGNHKLWLFRGIVREIFNRPSITLIALITAVIVVPTQNHASYSLRCQRHHRHYRKIERDVWSTRAVILCKSRNSPVSYLGAQNKYKTHVAQYIAGAFLCCAFTFLLHSQ